MLNEIRTFIQFKICYPYVKHGKNVHVQWSTRIWSPHKHIIFGNNVGIGAYCILGCDMEIGNNVMIGSGSGLVGSDDHMYNIVGKTMWESPRGDKKKIIIEDDVWIGHGCTIISGVRIGKGSIVAAGSVVVKDVKPYSIVAGVPAKCIKMRFTEEEIKKHESIIAQQSHLSK
jgi:acetyltransferase-like isoleucine patch superfamily enzyme